ncbi:MAG: zinc ribbon domain-containing protein [Candidatus Bathyarchaeia archaeon]
MKQIILAILLLSLAVFVIDVKPVHATSNVIYGSSTGFPADATISQVSFSRDGDSLVTSFQVKGQISDTTHYYVIAIQFTSSFMAYPPYRLVLSSLNHFRATHWDYAAQKTTQIQYDVKGNTWTSWTPLALLSGKTHFWVIAETGSGSSASTQYWEDTLLNVGNAFEIGLPTQMTFNLQPSLIKDKVALIVDDQQYNFDSNGKVAVTMDAGSSHSIAITSSIQTSNDTRYIFSKWSDSYGSQDKRSLIVEADSSLSASYDRQFLLTVRSDFGYLNGGGWYNEGSTASFSVSPVQSPYDGFLGTISLQHQFTGWSGDVVSTSASSSISMDGPKTVTASWKTVGGPLFLGLVGLILAMSLVAVFLLYRRGTIGLDFKLPSSIKRTRRKSRRTKRTQAVTEPAYAQETEASESITDVRKSAKPTVDKATMFCIQCGAVIPRNSKFCKECGNKLTE